MTTVTGLTADRMLAIEAASVVDGDVDASGNLILTQKGGSQINAGSVIGPAGPQGPVGSMLSVITAQPVLDVGVINQIRAGRQLGPADFGAMGLSAPLGLWNLSDLSDASGNGRNLSNKGGIPFAAGINGIANTAAQFTGSAAQALYIPDTGANDPFRIKVGSLGCWFRSAKRGVQQGLIVKSGSAGGNLGYFIQITTGNLIQLAIYGDGSNLLIGLSSISDVVDDRWHFAVGTYDGMTANMYIDGILESTINASGTMFATTGVLDIGGFYGDSSTATGLPIAGLIDEAFITPDILSEDQVRNLFCAKIAHTLGTSPTRVSLNIRRRRKGASLVVADFPTQPLRLHNFSGGSMADEGSNGVALSTSGYSSVAGVDGSAGNAIAFTSGQAVFSTDAGLPVGLATRSYGIWVKTISLATMTLMEWGTASTGHVAMYFNSGSIGFASAGDAIVGPFIADGLWRHLVVVENNTSSDGIKRKLYVDRRLVAISTVLNPVVLAGANNMRIGLAPTGATPFVGEVDSAFICDYALTPDRIAMLYAKGSQALTRSPKNVGDHIEGMDTNNLYVAFDALEVQHQVDIGVAS